MAIGKQLSDGNSQGTAHGQSATDLISFYGATPVAQRAAAIQANSVVSVSSNITIAASLLPGRTGRILPDARDAELTAATRTTLLNPNTRDADLTTHLAARLETT